MGWVVKRELKPDPSGRPRYAYRAGFRTADGKLVTKQFRRAHDARRWLAETEQAARSGLLSDPRRAREPFGNFFEYVMATTTLRPKTVEIYRGLIERHVLPAWASRPLETIAPADVKQLLAEVGRRTGAATVHAVYRVLRRILQVAVDEGRLARNPAARLKVPRPAPRAVRALEPAELFRLAEAAGPRWKAAVLVLGLGGLRVGELAGLRLRDWNPLKGTVTVERSATEVGGEIVIGPTKGGRPRTVTLPRPAREAVAAHVERLGLADPDAPLFPGPRGGLVRPTLFGRRVIRPAAARAGISPPPTTHQLRHTAVSLALAAGWNVRAIQELAGHRDVGTTMNVYGHLIEALHAEAVQRLDALLEERTEGGRVLPLRREDSGS